MSAVAPAPGVPLAESLRRVRDLRRADPELSLNGACQAAGVRASHVYDALARRKFKGVSPRLLDGVRYPRTNRRWTDEEIDLLLDLVREGQVPGEIAEVLARAPGAVAFRIMELRAAGRLALSEEPLVGAGAIWTLCTGCRPDTAGVNNVSRRVLRRWVACGALVGHWDDKGALRCSEGALWDALEDERTWPDWSPFKLRRPEWRDHFIARRGLLDCLSLTRISAEYGFPEGRLRRAIWCGVDGRRLPVAHRDGKRVYVRRLDLEAFDWSTCFIPAVRGLYYGRLLRPPRRRRP